MNVNHFLVGGNLTNDPELRALPDGRATANYRVAVNQYASDGEDTYVRCDFFVITSYGKQAENDAAFLCKGQEVLVECAVHGWYDEGKRKSGFNFVAKKVHYGSRPRQARPADTTAVSGSTRTAEGASPGRQRPSGGK